MNALFIIDLQKEFNPTAQLIQGIKDVIPNYSHIIQSEFNTHPESLFNKVLDYNPEVTKLINLNPDLLLSKSQYGLSDANIRIFKEFMNMCSITKLSLCGMETDACVMATAFSLWDNNIEFEVLHDLCQSPISIDYKPFFMRNFNC